MPRRPLGTPNPYGARCPECGEVIVLERYRGPRAHEYVCPRAKLEHGLPGDVHASLWLWSEDDLVRLRAGVETRWHQIRARGRDRSH